MSDFNQWRSKMHPAKSWVPPMGEADEKPRFNENIFASSSTSSISTLPKRKPRPKLKSYFGGHSHQPTESEHFLLDKRPAISIAAGASTSTIGAASQKSRDTTSATETVPDIELSITALMSRLLSDPGRGPSMQDYSLVLRIIESHRELGDKVATLEEELACEKEKNKRAEEELHQLGTIRAADEKDFRAEVKRLEMVIAEGKRGMSDLLRARQGSIIRRSRDIRESSDDGARWSDEQVGSLTYPMDNKSVHDSQQGLTRSVRLVPHSPSRKMADLSRQFHTADLQHESSFKMHLRGNETYMESEPSSHLLSREVNAQQIADAEFSSASSCGDPLPDELQRTPIAGDIIEREESKIFWQMADILAIRRGIPITDVTRALMELYQEQPTKNLSFVQDAPLCDQNNSTSPEFATYFWSDKEERASTTSLKCEAKRDFMSYEDLSPKTSGRRFSFCPNDDDAITLRESRSEQKAIIDKFEEERSTSSQGGIALVNSKIAFQKTFAKRSSQAFSTQLLSSGITENHDFKDNYNPVTGGVAAVITSATASVDDICSHPGLSSSFTEIKLSSDKDVASERERGSTAPHFARIPSSGSQQSAITAIWQDDSNNTGSHRGTENNYHGRGHVRCDSTQSSVSQVSRISGQSLRVVSLTAAASLAGEHNMLKKHEGAD